MKEKGGRGGGEVWFVIKSSRKESLVECGDEGANLTLSTPWDASDLCL